MATNNPEGFTPNPELPEANIEATVETPVRPDETGTETVDTVDAVNEDKKPSRLVKGIAGAVAGAVVLGGGIFGGLKLFGGENGNNPTNEPSVSGPETPGPTETETASNELITPNQELPPQKYISRSELIELSDSELREKCVVRVGDPGTETDEGLISVFTTKLTEAVQPYSEKLVDTFRGESGQLGTSSWMLYAEEARKYANRCTSFIYNKGNPIDADSPAGQTAKSVAYTNIITQDDREMDALLGGPIDNTYKYIWIKSDIVKGSVKKQPLEGRFAEYTFEEIITNNDEETQSEDIGTKGNWKGKYSGKIILGINANNEYYIVDYFDQLPAGEEK